MAAGWSAVLVFVACAAVVSIAVQYPPGSDRPQLTVLASVMWPLAWTYTFFSASRWARSMRQGDPAVARMRLARRVMWLGAFSGLVIAAVAAWALFRLDAFEHAKLRLTAGLVLAGWFGISALLLRPYRARG
jgi:hypothetical protein